MSGWKSQDSYDVNQKSCCLFSFDFSEIKGSILIEIEKGHYEESFSDLFSQSPDKYILPMPLENT